MIDFHSHVLPEIDDGAGNIDESIQILTMLKEQGVNTVVATPHYYEDENSIEIFIKNRNSSYNRLMHATRKNGLDLPSIELGAEVYLTPNTANDENLDQLCIGTTKCILIEMPYAFWYNWVYDSIYKIIAKRNLVPIIAHLERYVNRHTDIEQVEKLLAMNVFVQVNADSFEDRVYKKSIKKLFKYNSVHLLGSDSHNTNNRKPQMDIAYNKIIKNYGRNKWDLLFNNANMLLNK